LGVPASTEPRLEAPLPAGPSAYSSPLFSTALAFIRHLPAGLGGFSLHGRGPYYQTARGESPAPAPVTDCLALVLRAWDAFRTDPALLQASAAFVSLLQAVPGLALLFLQHLPWRILSRPDEAGRRGPRPQSVELVLPAGCGAIALAVEALLGLAGYPQLVFQPQGGHLALVLERRELRSLVTWAGGTSADLTGVRLAARWFYNGRPPKLNLGDFFSGRWGDRKRWGVPPAPFG
jgi:hypothetical protein